MSDDPYAAVQAQRPHGRAGLLVFGAAIAVLLGVGGVVLAAQKGLIGGETPQAGPAAQPGPAKQSPEQTCKQAGERYKSCVGEILGPEAQALASSPEKDGTAQCVADPMTVAMYEECLPKTGCQPFMDCMTDYAARTAPR